jgi:hypothetical protein
MGSGDSAREIASGPDIRQTRNSQIAATLAKLTACRTFAGATYKDEMALGD